MLGRLHRYLLRLIVPLMVMSVVTPVLAQESRTIEPGGSVTGTLDGEHIAQVYTFDAAQDDRVSLSVSSESNLGFALLLTDSGGVTIAQGVENAGATALTGVSLPRAGTYYVTVLAAPGETASTGSVFSLSFDLAAATSAPQPTAVPTAQPTESATFAPGEILTINGLQIALTWESLANLDLEVRDPVGGSVFFSTPTVPSGGQFGVNVNSVCDNRTADSPTENVVWPAGALPTGSYEMLVYYQPLDDCPTTDPASLSLNVTLDDQTLDAINGNLLPNEVFISSFMVGPDGALTGSASGLYTDNTVLPAAAADLLAEAQPITRDVPVTGLLTSEKFYDTYSFAGTANDLISVAMNATSGSLDTLLLLLDSSGNVIGSNDDAAQGNTDSTIANLRLFSDDTYTIVATRYGKDVGGTEGNFTLLLTGPTGDLPQEVLDLGLPRGDVEIALSWNTNADLQLLVRDPRGDSVFDDTPQVPSGGRLAAGGNVNCNISQTSPVSYVYWPQGLLAPGLYEVEVWYQNTCNDTRPVSFALNVLVNGTPALTQTAQPSANEIYLTSFVIGVDGQVRTSEGGFIGTRRQGGANDLDSSSLNISAELPNALAITSGQTVSGSITNDDKFDLYTFDGQASDVVTISMVATAGRLDNVLFLLDPSGFQIASNDDAVAGESTDSLIKEFTLPEAGQYTIIATHYGMQYGGTTGAYNLTFSRLN